MVDIGLGDTHGEGGGDKEKEDRIGEGKERRGEEEKVREEKEPGLGKLLGCEGRAS